MQLETERLTIKALKHDQLVKYIKCDHSLEAELQINPTERTMSPALKEAMETTILPNVADENKDYLFHTLWTAIDKTENKMVADICIISEPDANDEVEIGYGTYEAFQNKGYMSEVVGAMIKWLKTKSDVKAIIAYTEKTNEPSFKVLINNGFVNVGTAQELYFWKLEL